MPGQITINSITPKDSYLINFTFISHTLFKPFTIGLLLYLANLFVRSNYEANKSVIEILLTLALIYQVSILARSENIFYTNL